MPDASTSPGARGQGKGYDLKLSLRKGIWSCNSHLWRLWLVSLGAQCLTRVLGELQAGFTSRGGKEPGPGEVLLVKRSSYRSFSGSGEGGL